MTNPKEQLRDAALAYLVAHGVANVSLRPMAAAIGTSPRMLLFYFKSKEGLLQAVLEELNARLQASLGSMASADLGPNRVAPLKHFWEWATSKKNLPYIRLLYEVQIVALQNPAEYGRYLKKTSMDWQAVALRVMSDSNRTGPMATLCIAVFDGLFLELMSTGEHRRLTKALDHFISIGSPALPVSAAKSGRKQGRSQQERKTLGRARKTREKSERP